MRTQKQAEALAKRLVKRLGPGWEARVWSNCGWHYSASAVDGYLTVHDTGNGNRFFCLLSLSVRGTGDVAWSLAFNKHYRRPEDAVKHVVNAARDVMSERMAVMSKAVTAKIRMLNHVHQYVRQSRKAKR